jgi:membrane protein
MGVPGFRGLRFRDVGKRAVADFIEDDMMTYASAMSYHVFFALFPFIIFLLALLSFLNIPEFFDWILQRADTMLPPQAMEQVEEVVGEIQDQRRSGLLSFGMIAMLWTAGLALRSAMNALNRAYNVEEGRPIWKRYGLSLVYTLALMLLLILAAGFMIIGPQWMAALADVVGLEEVVVTMWAWIRLPVAVVLLMLALGLVYYFAPNVKHPLHLVTPGAVLAVLVWFLASLGFTLYVQSFTDYSATYGSVGAVIVLLFYFFISANAFLLGAEINAVIERETTKLELEDEPRKTKGSSGDRRKRRDREPAA